MECAQCGHENAPGARFCNRCGAPLGDQVSAGVRKTVTVLFCDLVGSTALGDRSDPEVVRELLARYHAELRAILERHSGTVEKFVGDAAMAVFGIPQVHEDDALRAVRAALDIQAAMGPLELVVRIGVNTGEVVAGTGGTLVTGDTVNVAARLEQSARPGEVLIGEMTRQLVRAAVRLEPVQPLKVKGKPEPLPAARVLELVGEAPLMTRPVDSPFLGREEERRELEQARAVAFDQNTPQLVTIMGAPGIGKSRLARELVIHSSARVLVGRCLSYGEGITYWPLAEIVAELEDLDMLLRGPDAALIKARIDAAVGTAETAVSPPELAWGFRKLFERVAQAQSTIVVFDDIHWAEPPLLDLIESIAALTADTSLLLLCTARPELLEARPSWSAPRPNAMVITLHPLSGNAIERLVEQLGETDEAAKRRISETADGNPLFVEQLVAFRSESGESEIPATLQGLLSARIDRLAEEERAVVACGSVEGRLFHRGAVTELLSTRPRPNVAQSLLALTKKELIGLGAPTVPGDDAFRFGHILIRDAAYQAIPKRRRTDLHQRYADWLANRLGHDAPNEILGYHLEQAAQYRDELGDPDPALGQRAAERLAVAARSAEGRQDVRATVNLLSRALKLTQAGPFQRSILVQLGRALYEAGETGPAQEALQQAAGASRDSGDRDHEWLARLQLALLRVHQEPKGAAEFAEAEARGAIESFAEAEDHEVLAHAWRLLAETHLLRSQAMDQSRALDRARHHARMAGDRTLEVESVLSSVPPILFGPVSVQKGLALVDEVVEQLGNAPVVQGFALHLEGHLKARLGEFEGAFEAITEWRSRFRELGQEVMYAHTSACVWDVASWAGEWKAGEEALREGYAFLEARGEKSYLSTVAAQLGEAQRRQGQLDEAEHYTEISEQLGSTDDQLNEAMWRAVRAEVLAARGEHEAAERLAGQAVELARGTDYLELEASTWLTLAEVYRAAGREAKQAAEHARALYEQKGNLVGVARAAALL